MRLAADELQRRTSSRSRHLRTRLIEDLLGGNAIAASSALQLRSSPRPSYASLAQRAALSASLAKARRPPSSFCHTIRATCQAFAVSCLAK